MLINKVKRHGISFPIRDASSSPTSAPTSFLRHYLSKRQPDADEGSTTLNEVLRQELGPLIALFGLDSEGAAKLRQALASVRTFADTAVIDLAEDRN